MISEQLYEKNTIRRLCWAKIPPFNPVLRLPYKRFHAWKNPGMKISWIKISFSKIFHAFMNGNHISMYANENVTPKISRGDFFFPEIFIGNWAVHFFMHEILIHKIFFYKFSFSFMEISFSCIEVSFLCMEISFQFVRAWNFC